MTKMDQQQSPGYYFNILGRNVFVTQAMKDYALEKLSKIERFHHHLVEVQVTLDIQKLEHTCMVILAFNHYKIKVSGVSTDMYASIDKAIDKLQSKVRRWKKRIQEHHQKPLSVIDMQVNVFQRPLDPVKEINDEIEMLNSQSLQEQYRPSKVIGTDSLPMKTLTTDEAIMKMELSEDHFMIFRGEEDLKLKVIYRRDDGAYGLIFPE